MLYPLSYEGKVADVQEFFLCDSRTRIPELRKVAKSAVNVRRGFGSLAAPAPAATLHR